MTDRAKAAHLQLSGGFAQVPNWATEYLDGKHHWNVYHRLCGHANEYGEAWPSVETLVRETKIERRALQRVINELQIAGLILAVRRFRPGKGWISNRYIIQPDPELYKDAIEKDFTPAVGTAGLLSRYAAGGFSFRAAIRDRLEAERCRDGALYVDPDGSILVPAVMLVPLFAQGQVATQAYMRPDSATMDGALCLAMRSIVPWSFILALTQWHVQRPDGYDDGEHNWGFCDGDNPADANDDKDDLVAKTTTTLVAETTTGVVAETTALLYQGNLPGNVYVADATCDAREIGTETSEASAFWEHYYAGRIAGGIAPSKQRGWLNGEAVVIHEGDTIPRGFSLSGPYELDIDQFDREGGFTLRLTDDEWLEAWSEYRLWHEWDKSIPDDDCDDAPYQCFEDWWVAVKAGHRPPEAA